MKCYSYIGTNPLLIGHTALGQELKNGMFLVQVDDIRHPWSHYWHTQPEEDWLEKIHT